MKGKPKDSKKFETLKEAQAFMIALNDNENCECYRLKR